MEKNKRIKFIILFCILLIIIISIVLVFIYMKNDNYKQNTQIKEPLNEGYVTVQDKEKAFKVVNCVSKYFETINKNNSTYFGSDKAGNNVRVVDEKTIKKNIYNLLSEDYIKENNVTEENVYSYIPNLENDIDFIALKMKVFKKDNIERYIVYGFVEKKDYTYIADIYITVNYDIQTNAFSVEPVKDGITDISKIEKTEFVISKIENNTVNKVVDININDEYVSGQYLYMYKKIVLSKPEYAYELLDKEYREKRFENVEVFKKYVENNKDSIKVLVLDKYLVNDSKTQYVCKDKNDLTYVFDIKEGVFDYTIKLDTYTIPTEEYTKKYNDATYEEKVSAVVDKFVYMINNKDFYNIYKMLDNDFKNNYFKTEEEFEIYMRKYFKYYYDYTIEGSSNQNSIYVVKLNLINKGETNNIPFNFNIFVKIADDGNPTISFKYADS